MQYTVHLTEAEADRVAASGIGLHTLIQRGLTGIALDAETAAELIRLRQVEAEHKAGQDLAAIPERARNAALEGTGVVLAGEPGDDAGAIVQEQRDSDDGFDSRSFQRRH